MSDVGEDRALYAVVLIVAGALGWNAIGDGAGNSGSRREPAPDVFEGRVIAIAEAIAMAEGYYAPGEHDGHTLPYRLNNPGSLKKPALNADALPTWMDTGLVLFPTKDMGWEALCHQVRLMLRGPSRVYDPTDTLVAAGRKYAGGDPNWAHNVAARLGVGAEATLSELVPFAPGSVRP
jgi:hypothetical protein